MPTLTGIDKQDVHVTVGVDTHADVHVAAALDQLGRLLDTHSAATTPAGYASLVGWAEQFGTLVRVGIEGTGSYGAGLARWLRARGHAVVEVERPKRQTRRRNGKSDPIDAEAAARAVQAGTASGQPKSGDGPIEMIRSLQAVRRSAVKARTQAANQLHALVVTAPDALRGTLRGCSLPQLVAKAAAFRASLPLTTPTAATKLALKSLARRYQQLRTEVEALDLQLSHLVAQAAPELLAVKGVSTITAACLLVTAGDNPARLRSEAAFAPPVRSGTYPGLLWQNNPASAEPGRRSRSEQGAVPARRPAMGWDPATRAYVARRTTEGLSKLEIIRCLKRYLARELFPLLAANPLLTTPSALIDPGIQRQ